MKTGRSRKSGRQTGNIGAKVSFFGRYRGVFSFLAAFVCCIAVFGAAAAAVLFSAIPVADILSGSTGKSVASSSHVSYAASNTFNMLICVYSENGGTPVEFMLYRLDTVKNKTVVMPVPLELAVTSQNSDSTIDDACSLAAVFKSGGISEAANALSGLLSIKINYTCSIDSANFLKLFNIFGGLYGAVPENINFIMPDGSGRIALAASQKQYLSGGKLYALIACPSYSGGSRVRYKEQSALMKEFVTEKLTGYYLQNVNTYYGNAFNCVSTDFSMNELLNCTDAMMALSESDSIETPLPSCSSTDKKLLQYSNDAAVKKYFN